MISRRALAVFVALGLLVWGPLPARAYLTLKSQSGRDLHWDAADIPVKWYTHRDRLTISPGFTGVEWGAALNALKRSFDTWQNVPCSTLSFSYEGAADADYTNMVSGTADKKSVIAFPDTAHWPGEWSGAYAVTIPSSGRDDGRIVDADMLFSPRFNWSTEGRGSVDTADLQNIATHEIGHVFGLDHPPGLEATMYYASLFGETYKRTLAPDDIQGLCHLYPRAKAVGLPCSSGADCASGSCEAHAPSGGSVCSQDCQCPADCPVPFGCQNGKCLPPGPDLGGLGYACDRSLPCDANGLCVSGMCSRYCQSGGDCPDAFSCTPLTGSGMACYRDGEPTHFSPGSRLLLASFLIDPATDIRAQTEITLSATVVREFGGATFNFSLKQPDAGRVLIANHGNAPSTTYIFQQDGHYTLRAELATSADAACPDDRREIEIDVGQADGDYNPPSDGDTEYERVEREYDFPKDWDDGGGSGPACRAVGAIAQGALLVLAFLLVVYRRRKKA